MMSGDLHSALREAITTRLAIAREASRTTYGATEAGEHWHWECRHCDTPVPITDVVLLDEFLECPNCESVGVDLRSVEHYDPNPQYRPLPHMVTNSCEEIRPVDGLFIATHDPQDAIRRYEADLQRLERHTWPDCWCSPYSPDCGELLLLAAVYPEVTP